MSSEYLIYEPHGGMRARAEESGVLIDSEGQPEPLNGVYCGVFSQRPEQGPSFIPYSQILWCEPHKAPSGTSLESVVLTYAKPKGASVEPATITVEIVHSLGLGQVSGPVSISEQVLAKAYPNGLRQPAICVLVNPHGGRGTAASVYSASVAPILNAAKASVVYQETEYNGHAVEIARDLDVASFDVVVCCLGDGTPHEVINGFYSRPNKGVEAFNKVCVTQLPCGLGNAMSLSTHGTNDAATATVAMLKAHRTKLDLMAVTQGRPGKQTTKLSFLTQTYGVVADSDIGTEHLRFLGPARFDLGILMKVLQRARYPCDLYVEEVAPKDAVEDHYDAHRISGNIQKPVKETDLQLRYPDGPHAPVPVTWTRVPVETADNVSTFYVGKMPVILNDAQFFPAALPNDGAMDMVITDSSALVPQMIRIMLLVERGKHVFHAKVEHAKILAYRLIPRVNDGGKHYISVDGEDFPCEPMQVEVLPGILTGLLAEKGFVPTVFAPESRPAVSQRP